MSLALLGRLRLSVNRLVILLTVPLILYFGVGLVQQWLEDYRLQVHRDRLLTEQQRLKEQQQQLRDQIGYYQSDAYIEQIAREQLGLVKPGDTAIAVVAPPPVERPPLTEPAPAAKPPAPDTRPVWQRWWDVFFG